MGLFSLVTWGGPIIGALGLYFDLQAVFWIGVVIAGLNLFMNLASGAMKFPILPLASAGIGIMLWQPWYVGAALGLLAWTTLEAAGELPPIRRMIGGLRSN